MLSFQYIQYIRKKDICNILYKVHKRIYSVKIGLSRYSICKLAKRSNRQLRRLISQSGIAFMLRRQFIFCFNYRDCGDLISCVLKKGSF
jgi:hypothetical protein